MGETRLAAPVTVFADLHRAHIAERLDPVTGLWLPAELVMDDAHPGAETWWVVVQPFHSAECARKIESPPDTPVRLLPRVQFTHWVSHTEAAVRLRISAREVLDLVLSGHLVGRLVLDHYEISKAAVARRIHYLATPGTPGLTVDAGSEHSQAGEAT